MVWQITYLPILMNYNKEPIQDTTFVSKVPHSYALRGNEVLFII